MALGNANTSAQSRGKNKPVIVKRRKEVVAAKNYYSISSSTVQSSNTCGANLSMTESYYYNGSNSLFPKVNDIIYTGRRARNPNKFTAGHYKMTRNGTQFVSLEVNDSGVVISRANCR